MSDRLTTLVGALLALLIAIALLSPPQAPDFDSLPTSVDRGEHGLKLLYDWLAQQKVPVHVSKRRYDELITYTELRESGNLLIVAEPQQVPAREQERQALLDWVAHGNSLLLLLAHSDAPDWAGGQARVRRQSEFPILDDLGFGIDWPPAPDSGRSESGPDAIVADANEAGDADSTEAYKEADEDGLYRVLTGTRATAQKLVPSGTGTILEGVTSIAVNTIGDIHPRTGLDTRGAHRGSLPLLQEQTQNIPALWRLRHGDGQIWVSRYGDLFGNQILVKQNNARLAWNLISQSLREGGAVIFDDMHFGITDVYDPEAFFGDSRLHNTLWFILGFWLIYVVGHSNRLAPPAESATPNSAAAFVRAMGGLFARRLSKLSIAQELFRHSFNDLRRRRGLPTDGQPVWELLRASPNIERDLLEELHTLYASLGTSRPASLLLIHNRLTQLRKQML